MNAGAGLLVSCVWGEGSLRWARGFAEGGREEGKEEERGEREREVPGRLSQEVLVRKDLV